MLCMILQGRRSILERPWEGKLESGKPALKTREDVDVMNLLFNSGGV